MSIPLHCKRALTGLLVLISSLRAVALDWQEVIVGDEMPGWHVRGDATAWTVHDGILHCNGAGKNWGEWIGTDRDYTDFVLEFDYKLPADGNSGVFVRCPPVGHPSQVAVEIQLLDDKADKHKALKPAQYTGSAYMIAAPARRLEHPTDVWHHAHIRVDGSWYLVKVDGEVFVSADGREFPEILKRSPRGGVGFQNHHTPVWFRNIRIADLTAHRLTQQSQLTIHPGALGLLLYCVQHGSL